MDKDENGTISHKEPSDTSGGERRVVLKLISSIMTRHFYSLPSPIPFPSQPLLLTQGAPARTLKMKDLVTQRDGQVHW